MDGITKILIVENNPVDIEFIQYELKNGGINFISEIVQNEPDYVNALERFTPHVILSDFSLPHFDGNTAFEISKQLAPETPFIFVSGTIGEEKSVEYIKNGVTDYVLKDKMFSLAVKVKRALEDVKERQEKKLAEEELKKSEKLFRVLIEKSKDMISLVSGDGDVIYASPFITNTLGYSVEELLHQHIYNFIHPDDSGEFAQQRDKLLKTPGGWFNFQVRRKHKNGSWVWCEGTVTNLLDEPGINATLTNFRDISERKRAEQDILDANENVKKAADDLQKIMDASLDIICTMDAEGRFLSVSKASFNILGYRPDELIGNDYIDFVFKEDVGKTANTGSGIRGGFSVTVFENRYLHKNGDIVYMLWSANWDEGDKIFYCTAKDITERKKAEQQREFDKNNLDALINNTNDLMWSVDRDFNLITFNKPFHAFALQVTGREIEKGASMLALDLPAEEFARYEKRYLRAFAGEIFTEVDYNSNPVEQWTEISFYPIRERGQIVGTACYARNITKEKEAERQLRNSEAFSRGILDALSSHISVINCQGNIISVNESWRRYGAKNGAATLERTGVGTNYFDVCERPAKAGDQIAAEALRGIKDVISEKIPFFYYEYPCHSPAGQQWFGLRAMKFESYEPMVVISHMDITVRKLAEENLVHSETKLKEAQAIAQIGNFEIDLLNDIHTWSDEIYHILGINVGDAVPSHQLFMSFVHPDDKIYVQSKFDEQAKSLKNEDFTFAFIRKDGSSRYGRSDARFEFRETGEPLRLFGIFQDITDRKLAEIERNTLVKDLLNRNAELEQFAYVASHDLQEPLRMISSFLSQLEIKYGSILDEKGRKYIYFAVDGARRMRQIILDLLEFSRVGKTEEELEDVDFNKLIKDILALYRRRLEEANARITFKNLPTIRTYKTPVRQVFQNLISNGLKYQKEGNPPLISITCTETKAEYRFAVKDNGIGIAPEYLERIFIIFQRLHNKDEYSGTGMGLAIVKKIAENMGGKVWAESIEGKGSTFYFTILKQSADERD